MLSFPAAIKVYLCTVPCDMRRSFDGLSMMAEHIIRCNPFSGHLLVYCNRRADRLKILYWDRDGWAIWYKRLESGTFQYPFADTGRKEIAASKASISARVEGANVTRCRPRQRRTQKTKKKAKSGAETLIFLLTKADSYVRLSV